MSEILRAAVPAEADRRRQAEVAAPKSVCTTPHKSPLKINRLRSRWVVLQVVGVVVGVKTTAGALPCVGGNIQQAFRGLRALPLHEDFADGFFGAFQL